MPEGEAYWQSMIDGLRKGNGETIMAFCAQYGDSLQRLADKHMAQGLRRRVGPEDVVQSVCRTFLRRMQGGEFLLHDNEGLWRLLCAITLTKVREQTRFHLRQKRGLAQEKHPGFVAGEGSADGFQIMDRGPSPAEAAEFADQFQQVLGSLDEEERQVIDLKLQEFTNEEIADRLGSSERTVRRVMKRVQAQLAKVFEVA